MPIDRATVDAFVAKLNATRRSDEWVKLEEFVGAGEFILSFPDRAMPPEQCIDQDFSEIQFALHDERSIDTNIVAGEKRDDGRYHMRYQVIDWD